MKVFCILSDERVYRSKSPHIFSTVMRRSGIRGAYVPFKVSPENIGQAMQSLRVLNIDGANVTAPYKEKVIPHLDVLSEGANIIGAINTIVVNGEELKGYNTNAIGFMDALSDADFNAEGKSALVFGTGGAARAVVFILNWLRTDTIYVVGRDPAKSRRIVEKFGGEALSLETASDAVPSAQLVVNATSVSSPDESPEMAELTGKLSVPDCELIVDLNYGRQKNCWQELSRRLSVRFIDGLSPLAFQARRTFALWTGAQVPPEEFLKALETEPL